MTIKYPVYGSPQIQQQNPNMRDEILARALDRGIGSVLGYFSHQADQERQQTRFDQQFGLQQQQFDAGQAQQQVQARAGAYKSVAEGMPAETAVGIYGQETLGQMALSPLQEGAPTVVQPPDTPYGPVLDQQGTQATNLPPTFEVPGDLTATAPSPLGAEEQQFTQERDEKRSLQVSSTLSGAIKGIDHTKSSLESAIQGIEGLKAAGRLDEDGYDDAFVRIYESHLAAVEAYKSKTKDEFDRRMKIARAGRSRAAQPRKVVDHKAIEDAYRMLPADADPNGPEAAAVGRLVTSIYQAGGVTFPLSGPQASATAQQRFGKERAKTKEREGKIRAQHFAQVGGMRDDEPAAIKYFMEHGEEMGYGKLTEEGARTALESLQAAVADTGSRALMKVPLQKKLAKLMRRQRGELDPVKAKKLMGQVTEILQSNSVSREQYRHFVAQTEKQKIKGKEKRVAGRTWAEFASDVGDEFYDAPGRIARGAGIVYSSVGAGLNAGQRAAEAKAGPQLQSTGGTWLRPSPEATASEQESIQAMGKGFGRVTSAVGDVAAKSFDALGEAVFGTPSEQQAYSSALKGIMQRRKGPAGLGMKTHAKIKKPRGKAASEIQRARFQTITQALEPYRESVEQMQGAVGAVAQDYFRLGGTPESYLEGTGPDEMDRLAALDAHIPAGVFAMDRSFGEALQDLADLQME